MFVVFVIIIISFSLLWNLPPSIQIPKLPPLLKYPQIVVLSNFTYVINMSKKILLVWSYLVKIFLLLSDRSSVWSSYVYLFLLWPRDGVFTRGLVISGFRLSNLRSQLSTFILYYWHWNLTAHTRFRYAFLYSRFCFFFPLYLNWRAFDL